MKTVSIIDKHKHVNKRTGGGGNHGGGIKANLCVDEALRDSGNDCKQVLPLAACSHASYCLCIPERVTSSAWDEHEQTFAG